MRTRRLFYSKCRPQGSDAWEVAEAAKRVFVGYPVFATRRKGVNWRETGCRRLFRDLGDPAWRDSWTANLPRGYRSQVTLNRRIALEIEADSIVLVPRIQQGVCYAGRVTRSFELVDHPGWADLYLDLRRRAALDIDDENECVGNIAQTWPVDSWRAVPFPAIPRWISYRLLSRNTVGTIENLQEADVTALEAIEGLMDNPGRYSTIGRTNLEADLLTWLNPTSFEHLIVHLLQLEADHHTFWHHVGGSGDGGVDGIAVDEKGHHKGVLQCKWHYDGSVGALLDNLGSSRFRTVVAILHGTQESDVSLKKHQEFWNRTRIAGLVRKHRTRLPLAGSFGLWRTS